ncbi:Endoglucanase Z precursor [compost metagenome]
MKSFVKSIVMTVLFSLITLLFQAVGPAPTTSAATVGCPNPVSYFGEMKVSGNRINGSKTNSPVMVKGSSFFWSNWSSHFWNASTVNRLVDELQVEIVRAAYGIDQNGNPYNTADESKLRDVVNAAVAKGIYVIIDWHSHDAHKNPDAAKNFFSQMAKDYGSYDNVIFEIYNEPTQISWSTVKSYAEQIIPAIRQHSDNLIIVGTPFWSQDVDVAADDPITSYGNIAYGLHFYAGSHSQFLRDKANTALNKGVPLFVTEMGFVNADGDGGVNYDSTNQWIDWMNQNNISWANWSVHDKAEGASIFNTNGSLTVSGSYLKNILAGHAPYAEWKKATSCDDGGGNGTTYSIPGTVEAENYSSMSGIRTGSTSDIGGGSVVGYIDSGDWMDYKVDVQTAGSYIIQYRVASAVNSGKFELRSGSTVLASTTVPNTGGWENWQTLSTNVNLAAGPQTLRIYATGSGFNINWFTATKNTGGGNEGGNPTTLYSFEGSTQEWIGYNVLAGPWSVNEWSSKGDHSLKADIMMSSNSLHYLFLAQNRNLSGKSTLSATVKHASWGSVGDGLYAKIYVKTGSDWTWFSSNDAKLNSSGSATLTLNLSSVSNLGDVREIGVQFISSANSSSQTAVYVDNVTLE